MKRSDLTRSLQVQFKGMREADANAMLENVINDAKQAVARGDRIEIRGFGVFMSRKRASKTGYNPSTGEMMHLDAGKTILFKPSRELTKKMNG